MEKKSENKKEKIYDLVIIGAGPAGLTAGIYAGRYKLKSIIIGKIPGGYAGTAQKIYNFPSYNEINGIELMIKMIKQVKDFDIEIKQEIAKDIKRNKKIFEITTEKNKYYCKKLILATGTEKNKLGLDKEKELTGKGISYCTTCDSGLYKDKVVAVIGGGNSAITDALLLSKYAKKVYLIYRKETFSKAEEVLTEEMKSKENIEILFDANVKRLIGDTKLKEIEVISEEKSRTLKVDGLFIQIGNEPSIGLAQKLRLKLENREIIVDKKQKTNVEGVFAAGDVTNIPFKQIVTACSGGAIATHTIYKELINEKNKNF